MAHNINDLLAPRSTELWDGLAQGAHWATLYKTLPLWVLDAVGEVRSLYGFASRYSQILTDPSANTKLDEASRVAYGLTLQHANVALLGDLGRVEMCPHRGHCTRVCVLDNGNGAYPAVQRARMWKTHLLVEQPWVFAFVLGFELGRVTVTHPNGFDLRPNVNSDIDWHLILPALGDGTLFPTMWMYGYTKSTAVLATDGWLAPRYRAAFSANENVGINNLQVRGFLARGGSVAVVTNRKQHAPVAQWDRTYKVLDASADDSWMWEPSTIGDLSAKGKARTIIGRSGFIHTPYAV